mmetsp:Transcript_92880/g.194122  ORF Transcript_92880/g.194122 Transcript_92880/m.194122 type:complete len:229 (+) Transcript_92880:446-1132(+)
MRNDLRRNTCQLLVQQGLDPIGDWIVRMEDIKESPTSAGDFGRPTKVKASETPQRSLAPLRESDAQEHSERRSDGEEAARDWALRQGGILVASRFCSCSHQVSHRFLMIGVCLVLSHHAPEMSHFLNHIEHDDAAQRVAHHGDFARKMGCSGTEQSEEPGHFAQELFMNRFSPLIVLVDHDVGDGKVCEVPQARDRGEGHVLETGTNAARNVHRLVPLEREEFYAARN